MPIKLCPICGIELNTRTIYGVETNFCPKCGGIWLDGGKLNQLLENVKGTTHEHEEEEYDEYKNKEKKRSFFEFFDIFD